MTAEVAQRFKLIRRDLIEYGSRNQPQMVAMLDQLAHQVPLIGAMTTRNFEEIRELLDWGTRLEPTMTEQERVVARGIAKVAPFHRSRNSVADALLIEMYSTAVKGGGPDDWYSFVTSNSEDFSAVGGDNRDPHNDFADIFDGDRSEYRLGVEGLDAALTDDFGQELTEITAETYFEEEPRRLDEILSAEQELFDRIWYDRSMLDEQKALDAGDEAEVERIRRIAGPGRARVEQTYGAENLGPYDKSDWGMLNGKLSALRWVLGSQWDFLDT